MQMKHVKLFFVLLSFAYFVDAKEQKISYSFTFKDIPYEVSFVEHNSEFCQDAYSKLDHVTVDNYKRFLSNYPCEGGMLKVMDILKRIIDEEEFDRLDTASFLLNFARSIPYSRDDETTRLSDYIRYPYEMLLDGSGDCEDHAILYASLLSQFCFGSVLLLLPRHLAVGLYTNTFERSCEGTYYEINGTKYFYCEPTPCGTQNCGERNVGEMPSLEGEKKTSRLVEDVYHVQMQCRYRVPPHTTSKNVPVFVKEENFMGIIKSSKEREMMMKDMKVVDFKEMK